MNKVKIIRKVYPPTVLPTEEGFLLHCPLENWMEFHSVKQSMKVIQGEFTREEKPKLSACCDNFHRQQLVFQAENNAYIYFMGESEDLLEKAVGFVSPSSIFSKLLKWQEYWVAATQSATLNIWSTKQQLPTHQLNTPLIEFCSFEELPALHRKDQSLIFLSKNHICGHDMECGERNYIDLKGKNWNHYLENEKYGVCYGRRGMGMVDWRMNGYIWLHEDTCRHLEFQGQNTFLYASGSNIIRSDVRMLERTETLFSENYQVRKFHCSENYWVICEEFNPITYVYSHQN